ncbi:MAG: fatty acid CoA ligase family protein [Planctomycetota bacterium]
MALSVRDQAVEELAGPDPATCNVAHYLSVIAARSPQSVAVVVQARRGARRSCHRLTYAELEAHSNRYANGLAEIGIVRGTRTLVMVRPGCEFIALVFALFKIGAVPVLIDPGMGVRQMLRCIRTVEPEAFVAIPPAHAVRVLQPRAFQSVRHTVTVGRRWFWGGPTLQELLDRAGGEFDLAPTKPDDTAAILFTSGSTGPAKGVVYEHGMFHVQVRWIQAHYGIEPGEVDLSAFPLFALFSPAMGMTSVVPEMDPSRPAQVDPARLVEAINDHQVTNSFGSPAIWSRVAAYCLDRGLKLPTIRRILIAGAPVSWQLLDRLQQVLGPSAEIHTPYGATESLPVSSIAAREVLADCSLRSRGGAGTCVGRSLSGMELRIIRITDEVVPEWSDDLQVPDGEIGEIVVSGPVVTRQYYGLPQATALAKIRDGSRIWHRMGDVGYRDEQGRIWFCGRKAHRVVTKTGTMFTAQCEAIFNEHADVFRSALVGVGLEGRKRPVIVIEPESGKFPRGRRVESLKTELLELSRANELTRGIEDVLFHRGFPVDVRHNVKIDREKLARWAARRVP